MQMGERTCFLGRYTDETTQSAANDVALFRGPPPVFAVQFHLFVRQRQEQSIAGVLTLSLWRRLG